jgi:hypothetical protein
LIARATGALAATNACLRHRVAFRRRLAVLAIAGTGEPAERGAQRAGEVRRSRVERLRGEDHEPCRGGFAVERLEDPLAPLPAREQRDAAQVSVRRDATRDRAGLLFRVE